MTFKHITFDDSTTMRSLIKVAAEKGWVKSEPIQKTASASEDLSPGENLTENIIKLCSGLRNSGLDKYADEIENKFIVYKRANNLYGVHKEDGKDLIDAAHPKGGHKMEDLEGDAFVETVLEKQLKILNVVNKKPTGKLASHANILNAVKIVLAGNPAKVKAQLQKVLANVNTIFTLNEQQGFLRKISLQGEDKLKDLINSAIQNANNPDELEGLYYQIRSGLQSFQKGFKPGWIAGGVTDEVWSNMEPLFASAYAALDEAKKLAEMPDAPVVEKKPLADLLQQLSSIINKVQSWKAIGSIVKQPAAIQWLQSEVATLNDIKKRYEAAPEDQQANLVGSLRKEISAELTDIDQFEKNWVTG